MNINRMIGAILLIAGTCIGAGMLALPVSTAAYGFYPSAVLFIVCWAFLTFTALLILEVNLWSKSDSNMISMAAQTLGKAGQVVAWLAYLLLLYSLMSAYLSGMNSLLTVTINNIFAVKLTPWVGSLILIIIFGIIIYLGTRPIDYINRILILGLVVTYFLLVGFVAPHVQLQQLDTSTFNKLWVAAPIAITAFGYHIIIPSLRTYLNNDVKKLRLTVIIGSAIPLVIYLAWEGLILGSLPKTGPHGLLAILTSGQPSVGLAQALDKITQSHWVSLIAKYFAFFAIATSFVGVSLSLFDFLADGFHIKKTKLGRLSTAVITFLPPLVFVLAYPHGFILALGYAGIFVAILLGVLPAMMAWSGRYIKKIAAPYHTFGGKPLLCITIIFFIAVIIIELAS